MSSWDEHYLFIYFYLNRSLTVDPSLLGAERGLAAARTQWESLSHPAQGVKEGEGGGEQQSRESVCGVGAIFGGIRLACYFCQRESRAERSGGEAAAAAAAAQEGDGLFLFCNLPP